MTLDPKAEASVQQILQSMSLRSDAEAHLLLSYIKRLEKEHAAMKEAMDSQREECQCTQSSLKDSFGGTFACRNCQRIRTVLSSLSL